jgi:hypothetical protein
MTMTMDESKDYWLPPASYDLNKLKPRRLDLDEYDEMHTALDTIHKWAEKVGPEKVNL